MLYRLSKRSIKGDVMKKFKSDFPNLFIKDLDYIESAYGNLLDVLRHVRSRMPTGEPERKALREMFERVLPDYESVVKALKYAVETHYSQFDEEWDED